MISEGLRFLYWTLFVWIFFACIVDGATNTRTRGPKKYVINLGLPPEQRWTRVVEDYAKAIKDVIWDFRALVPEGSIVFPLIEKIASDIEKYIPAPFAKEMKGIAKLLNVNIGDIVLSNLMYDVTAFCTSIVSEDNKGRVWHSRNLDFPFMNMLKKITVEVDFQRNGKTLYNAVTFAGYVGILTGQRPYEFTVSVDRRAEGDALLNLLVGLFDHSVVPVSFLVRDAMANSTNYTAAVDQLGYTPTAAPVYFIIAGVRPGDAAVITKDRLKPHDIWTIDPEKGRWFEVETNYDHWKPPPHKDNRRDPAIRAMKAVGRSNISVKKLFNVMSTHPVLNHHTIYTVVMSAANPKTFQTWIRHEN